SCLRSIQPTRRTQLTFLHRPGCRARMVPTLQFRDLVLESRTLVHRPTTSDRIVETPIPQPLIMDTLEVEFRGAIQMLTQL
ncbi:hypothetical protein HAX54_043367, partial [Datura stramonium]|nr:hypothetical protein [Datura stramonium]